MTYPPAPLRVLIRTLPLANGNYGGALQAYALQQIVEDLEAWPSTDTSRADAFGGWAIAVRRIVKAILTRVPYVRCAVPEVWQHQRLQKLLARPINLFVRDQIRTVRVYNPLGAVRRRALRGVGLFLVGSDQVWRDAYGDVPSYLFDFAGTHPAVKASYAASFGIDDPRLEASHTETWRTLARAFDAVSIRERSGAEYARREWGVNARVDLDPTMLLDADHYAALANCVPASPRPLRFVLDSSAEVNQVVQRVESAVGPMRDLVPPYPRDLRTYESEPQRYDRPSVNEWLAAFRDAQFVVTDSFHGTVFAIINRKPFLTIVNSSRGRARFDTLLSAAGLSERAVTEAASAAAIDELVARPIDWREVESRLAPLRHEGIEYLRALVTQ